MNRFNAKTADLSPPMTTLETRSVAGPLACAPAAVARRSGARRGARPLERDARRVGPVQPFVVAGLAHFSERPRSLVVTPTVADAERLVDDLRCFLLDAPEPGGAVGSVELFSPWETLPFERVSPEVQTMGAGWRCCGVSSATSRSRPIRAVDRRGPGPGGAPAARRRGGTPPGPSWSAAATGSSRASCWSGSSSTATGGSTRSSTAARWPCAAASSTSSPRPPTAPVRIDLFGDEVDRLTTFDIGDQRSTGDLELAVIFGCREMVLDRGDAGPGRAGCRQRGRSAGASGSGWPRGSSSTAWRRGCRGWPRVSRC